MAITFRQQPTTTDYHPSDNSIDFVFSSNQYTQPNFVFVVETWIDSAKIGTDYVYVKTSGYAHFDASKYVCVVARIWDDFSTQVSNDRTYNLQLRVAERYGATPTTGTFSNSSTIMTYKASLLNYENHTYPAVADILSDRRVYNLPTMVNFPFIVGFRYANGNSFQLYDGLTNVLNLDLNTLMNNNQLQFINLSSYINAAASKTYGEIDFQNGLTKIYFDPCLRYVVMYLNKYGGWDYFSNIHNVIDGENITRNTYQRTNGDWNGTTFGRNYNHGNADYLNRFTQNGTIVTNDLNDDDQLIVKEILESPYVILSDALDMKRPYKRIRLTNSNFTLNQNRYEDARAILINFEDVNTNSSILL